MNKQSSPQVKQTVTRNAVVSAPSSILQRKCATCGMHTVAGNKCDECKKGALQRKAFANPEQTEVPPIVYEVLNSSGQPLDESTRSFFEPRFAHNFSQVPVSSVSPQVSQSSLKIGESGDIYEQEADRIADSVMRKQSSETSTANEEQNGKFDLSRVRVHTDSRAAESARAINAQAYTLGNNIVFGAGQFAPGTNKGQHLLAHELTHVAQQTGTIGGAINNQSLISQAVQRNFIQRETVTTNFGEFETTKLEESENRGVEIILKFHPDENKVDAKKIAFSQSIINRNKSGAVYGHDPNQTTKMVESGKPGAGYAIDNLTDSNNPLYAQDSNLAAGQSLAHTRESANKSGMPTEVGVNTNYELGHCFKEKPTDTAKKKRSATMWDRPLSDGNKGESKTFETVALAIDGKDKNKYYGSVKWGYRIEEAGVVKIDDITEASKEMPTDNFIEAAKMWNKGKTRKTYKVIANPSADVVLMDGTKEKLAKGIKLIQTNVGGVDGEPVIIAEVLKANGKSSGKAVLIKNSDVQDAGDGSNTVDLPIPVAKPAVKKMP